ncbi:MAG: hypothetical protein RIS94_1250 [Pseudomonadota bacterium]|jgi:outer membrane autotransporter protein
MIAALRNRLTLSALATASSLIALAAPAHAQSVCVATGGTFDCTDGTVTATGTFAGTGATLVSLPQTLSLTGTGDLAVTAGGTVTSTAALPALHIVSTGNLAVTAADAGAINVTATGTGPAAILQSSGGTVNAQLGTLSSTNSFALFATSAQGTTVTTGSVTGAGFGTAGVGSSNGVAALTVNGNVVNTNTTANGIGALAVASNGDASVTVTGNVDATSTADVIGVAVVGTNATANVGGTVTVSGTGSAPSAGIFSLANNGLSSVTCGNVNATGNGIGGVIAAGNDVVIRCGNVTTNGDAAVGVTAAATNSIDAIVGNVTTDGLGSTGLLLSATGPIAVTTGNIQTAGDNSPGLVILGDTGAVTATTGTITTTGAASDGLVVSTTTGAIGVNAGAISATGAGSRGIVSTSTTGDQTITVAGVQSDGDGVFATAGTGAITVNATAPVSSAAGYGINALGTTGPITINTAGADGALGAINAFASGDGAVGVNATGGTTTSATGDAIRLETLGTATTAVATGATVTGQGAFDAIDTRGATANAVTVAGTLGVPAAGTGYAINATGGATTVAVVSGGTVYGPVSLTANDDTVTNAGTLTLTRTSDFGAGTDTLSNLAGGTLNLNQGATVNGLEVLGNAGTANVAGTTDLGGATFNNLAGGRIVAVNGAATLAGVPTLNNAGLITMVDGATNDTLTLPGNYAGSGAARLALDVDAGLTSADKLVVGGNVSGVTTVDINRVGTALYNPTGALIVQTTGTVANGAFVIAPEDVASGFLNYGLRQSGGNTYVVSTLDNSVTDLAMVGSLGRDLWYQSFDAYHDAIMGRHAGALTTGHPIGIWGQLYDSKDKYGHDGRTTTIGGQTVTYSNRMKTHHEGAQVGLEYRGPGWVIGATGGWEAADTEDNPIDARVRADGHNYGAYALFGMKNGLYAGLMYKRDEFHVNFTNGARAVGFRTKAHSDGVDGEIGFRGNAQAIAFDLNAGLSYVKTRIDPWNQYGLAFSWDDNKSLRGRIGGQVIFPQALGAFVGAKVFHEFEHKGQLAISNAALVGEVPLEDRGTWVRLEAGLNGSGTNGILLSVWGDLGDTKGFGGRVGFRF